MLRLFTSYLTLLAVGVRGQTYTISATTHVGSCGQPTFSQDCVHDRPPGANKLGRAEDYCSVFATHTSDGTLYDRTAGTALTQGTLTSTFSSLVVNIGGDVWAPHSDRAGDFLLLSAGSYRCMSHACPYGPPGWGYPGLGNTHFAPLALCCDHSCHKCNVVSLGETDRNLGLWYDSWVAKCNEPGVAPTCTQAEIEAVGGTCPGSVAAAIMFRASGPSTPGGGPSTPSGGGSSPSGSGGAPAGPAPNTPAGDPANYGSQYDGGASSHTGPVKTDAGNDNTGSNQNYQDSSPNPTGASHGAKDNRKEPHATWSGDLDPRSRRLSGTITVRPGLNSIGLRRFDLFGTGNGSAKIGGSAGSYIVSTGSGQAKDGLNDCESSCVNNSPWSPTCSGSSCTDTVKIVAHDGTSRTATRDLITILPGDGGEFYVSRVQNDICNYATSNAGGTTLDHTEETDPADETNDLLNTRTCAGDTAQDGKRTPQTMGEGESATISFPAGGYLTLVYLDANDKLTLGGDVTNTMNTYQDIPAAGTLTHATTSGVTGKGWTVLYQPNYPEIELDAKHMEDGASGYIVVPTFTSGEDTINIRYVETRDWLVPNVTCTPTTMHCPIPNVWAHVDYTTPSMYPEPAEGSCEQVKTKSTAGSVDFTNCGDKTDTDDRWYATGSKSTTDKPGTSSNGDNEEENGQAFADDKYGVKHANWAGNCGGATSYFWFEKIACGSTRTFHTDGRSLIEDNVVLSPTWENIKDILAKYYTTKAPLPGPSGNAGFTFINADYHVAPVLPPKVECSCLAAMDAYASLLSVQSKTPTPGAPVTLDPEVLNTGTSKIVATLRMYHDPTYSLTATADSTMPIVVSRFYVEVSTKFTRNRITISDCTSSNVEGDLNSTKAVKPRTEYCDNSTFDTRTEASPGGVTHMDRLSMKKFKFHGSTDVFMQCKIRACAAQPCGTCKPASGRQLATSSDLSPVEGEMFAPPHKIRVSAFDKNAMVFAAPEASAPRPSSPSAVATLTDTVAKTTAQPVRVASQLTLPFTATWANENRAEVASSLRTTLGLSAADDLVITSISAARRLAERELQSAGVKVDFVVSVADSHANKTTATLGALSSGQTAFVQAFAVILNQNLASGGKATVQLEASQIKFARAEVVTASTSSASRPNVMMAQQQTTTESVEGTAAVSTKTEAGSGSNLVPVLLLVVVTAGALYVLLGRKQKRADVTQESQDEVRCDTRYASKVLEFEN